MTFIIFCREEKMLSVAEKSIQIVKERSDNKSKRKESLRDFLSALGSLSTLPPQSDKFSSTNSGILHQVL